MQFRKYKLRKDHSRNIYKMLKAKGSKYDKETDSWFSVLASTPLANKDLTKTRQWEKTQLEKRKNFDKQSLKEENY